MIVMELQLHFQSNGTQPLDDQIQMVAVARIVSSIIVIWKNGLVNWEIIDAVVLIPQFVSKLYKTLYV